MKQLSLIGETSWQTRRPGLARVTMEDCATPAEQEVLGEGQLKDVWCLQPFPLLYQDHLHVAPFPEEDYDRLNDGATQWHYQ